MTRIGSGRRPRVMMLGLRGIPEIQGGVEKHVEELGRWLDESWDITVIGRKPYLPSSKPYDVGHVRVLPVWSPRSMKFEALAHTLFGVLLAAVRRPDILHIHAVGPALLTPLARLCGLRTVVTHHGYDYDREKWGALARRVLRLGEVAGMRFASRRIAVSNEIARTMERRYSVPTRFIPNGVATRQGAADTDILAELGLVSRRYVITVARIVPEKRQHDLIAAFEQLADPSLRLVLVGAADHDAAYPREVAALAARVPGVILAGRRTGDDLFTLYAHAGLFVLPSSHEGMPLVLLEALGAGAPVLASGITANRELGLPEEDYFPVGDVPALSRAMRKKFATPFDPAASMERSQWVKQAYSWQRVAQQVADIYTDLLAV
ncbi:glycosyltransferase family 4 protein [Labrys sp. KNU-23]|uniref:glycosyltransferase family 4 protein n=1 Tax=Labrys sp. KNU-23 TaxID=2789216 RepID=UPI0011EEDBF0|nr:glycosyltransferase family 4 protein [Labrys sp. KNU-23]QEN85039.1 glycosyltransferase family 4 protein [Labrys sp. KNU-23]